MVEKAVGCGNDRIDAGRESYAMDPVASLLEVVIGCLLIQSDGNRILLKPGKTEIEALC